MYNSSSAREVREGASEIFSLPPWTAAVGRGVRTAESQPARSFVRYQVPGSRDEGNHDMYASRYLEGCLLQLNFPPRGLC